MKNNWKQRTLENLENDFSSLPDQDSSYLVKRCCELRKMPLEKFTTEDLRIMIGQQIGLKYLIPLAIETLSKDLFAEGDYFEGDLLKNVLSVDTEFWNDNKDYWLQLNRLVKVRRNEIMGHKFDLANFDNCKYKYKNMTNER